MLPLFAYHTNPEVLDWSTLTSTGAAKYLLKMCTKTELIDGSVEYRFLPKDPKIAIMFFNKISSLNELNDVFKKYVFNARYLTTLVPTTAVEPLIAKASSQDIHDFAMIFNITPHHKWYQLLPSKNVDDSFYGDKHPETIASLMFKNNIRKGDPQFKEGADKIKDNAYASMMYARNTNERFIEGEPAILKSAGSANHHIFDFYVRTFFGGNYGLARQEMSDKKDNVNSLDDFFRSLAGWFNHIDQL